MPRLVVDARVLYGSGIGRYVRELVPRIMRTGRFDALTLVGDPQELAPWCAAEGLGADIVALPYGRYAWQVQTAWPSVDRALPKGPRVVWFPHFDAPVLRLPHPAVVTVHDLIPLHPSHGSGWARQQAMRVVVRRVVARAQAVITISSASASALRAFMTGVELPLHVIPNGGGEFAAQAEGTLPAGLTAPVALVVGNVKAHKNVVRGVEAVAAVRATGRALTLVVVGTDSAHAAVIRARSAALGVTPHVLMLGTVSDAMLRALYAACAVVLAPSYVEGFGLPVVEALSCGAPVVAADAPWAHETGGAVTRYAPPDDTAAWRSVVCATLDEGRAARSTAAVAWATQFTWDAAATRTATVLAAAVGAR
jgi:glycosyltransferase involved in cell wall biosynthesis